MSSTNNAHFDTSLYDESVACWPVMGIVLVIAITLWFVSARKTGPVRTLPSSTLSCVTLDGGIVGRYEAVTRLHEIDRSGLYS